MVSSENSADALLGLELLKNYQISDLIWCAITQDCRFLDRAVWRMTRSKTEHILPFGDIDKFDFNNSEHIKL